MTYYDLADGELSPIASFTVYDNPGAVLRAAHSVMTTSASVDELLADARSRLDRVSPGESARAVTDGALLVDIRPHWQRVRDGRTVRARW